MLYIIANLLSGGGRGKKNLTAVEAYLKSENIPYRLLISTYATESIEHGKRCAADDECTRIAVLGGDGTFNEAVNGLGESKKPVGFIAGGTGNDFMRASGLPADPVEAIKVVLNGEIKPVDIILFGSRRCLNVLGTGLDVEILSRANRYRRFFKDKTSYHISLFVTILCYKNRTCTFSVDGGEKKNVQAMMVSIANGRYCGGGLPVAPKGDMHDGKIDFVVIRKVNRLKLPYLLTMFLKGKLLTLKCTDFYRCERLSLDVAPKIPMNCDGELIDCLPTEISILPGALNCIMPKKQ